MRVIDKVKIHLITACLALLVSHAVAAPGQLSKTPLYAGAAVPANILFLMDDSGSMYFQVLIKPKAKQAIDQVFDSYGELERGFLFKSFPTYPEVPKKANPWKYVEMDDYQLDYPYSPIEWGWKDAARTCLGVNALAYDPDTEYVPWDGDDPDGVAYKQAEKIVKNILPHDGTEDISYHAYTSWDKPASSDAEFKWEQCGITTDSSGKPNGYNASQIVAVASLTEEEQKNYANWYKYYRDRLSVFKSVLSGVFEQLDSRAAYATINAQANLGWAMEMANVNNLDLTHPEISARQASKAALVKALLETGDVMKERSGITPLRLALENAGRYYAVSSTMAHEDEPQQNFASITTPASPMLAENSGGVCQKNFTVLATDGYIYETKTAKPEKNYGDLDGDGLGNTLGDIAYYFYNRDLRPDMGVSNPENLNDAQNMVTHTLSFGLGKGEVPASWPTSIDYGASDSNSLFDVIHAAHNSNGKYLPADDLGTLKTGFEEILKAIGEAVDGTGAAVGLNSTSIASDTALFQGWFDTGDWSGDLIAKEYTHDDKGVASVGNALWHAKAVLDTQMEAGNIGRRIITSRSGTGIVFKAPGDFSSLASDELSQGQIDDLLTGYTGTASETQAYLERIISYLRGVGDEYSGDASVSTEFRKRSSRLADIVNSGPRYVATPRASYPNLIEGSDKPYYDFISDKKDRTPIVYVGANDGMLHAFNATTGVEVFAYIPQAVFSDNHYEGLHALASVNYVHQPYVDASPSVGDVYIDSWKTYLLGGLGAGGKGIYVLDITDPYNLGGGSSASLPTEQQLTSIVVTEFTDQHLGYTFSQPQIAKLNDGKWVAVFGNGYNNDSDGKAYLYVLELEPDTSGKFNFQKLVLGTTGTVVNDSCIDPASDCNGLSSPTLLDLNSDGKLDRVYAGDIHGNLWAVDFTKKDGSGDVVPEIAHTLTGGAAVPLFKACRASVDSGKFCAKADRQPITVRPKVVAHRSKRGAATYPNLMVLFGTGQYLTELDPGNTEQQNLYGVWDAGAANGDLSAAKLVSQTISNVSGDTEGKLSLTTNSVQYSLTGTSPVLGWKAPLIDTGERLVIPPALVGDVLLYGTTIPDTGSDPCLPGGTGHLIAMDIFTGGKLPYDVFPDRPGSSGFDVNKLLGGMTVVDNDIILSDADGGIASHRARWQKERPSRRSSWAIQK